MESSLKHPVILLFEDQRYLDESTKVLLDMGHEVYATQSPFEAINVFHNLTRSPILLIDYTMTEMQPRHFVKYVHQINRFDLFGILVTEDVESDEKRIMREDAKTDGLLTHFQRSRKMADGKTIYDLGTLYRREIMSAEEMLCKLTARIEDPLTKLPNRFGGLEQWEAEWNRRIRNKGPVSFVMLDFNGMKITNDTFGHQAGDVLIQKFATKLREELRTKDKNDARPEDLVIRWGGDEFLIIMPNTSRQKAAFAIKRLKEVFKQTQFEIAPNVFIPVPFCAGLVTHTGKSVEHTAESVFKESTQLADIALYEDKAKNPKRNELILAALNKKKQ